VATPPVLGGLGVSGSEKPLAATQAVLELATAVQAVLGANVRVVILHIVSRCVDVVS
jgi:hypothetical protein